MNNLEPILPDEVIISKIYLIRGQKVMLDSDLAVLYEVETKSTEAGSKKEYGYFSSAFYV